MRPPAAGLLFALTAAALLVSGCAALQPVPEPAETAKPPPPAPPPRPEEKPPEAEEPAPEPIPAPQPTPRATWVEARERTARGLEASGELARALTQWKLVRLLEPDTPAWGEHIAGLRRRIADKVAPLLAKGDSARTAGDARGAAAAFLGVLALDPRNKQAAQSLRELEAEEIRGREQAKVDKLGPKARNSMPAQPSKQPLPQNQAPEGSQASFYLETGIELFRQGEYEKCIVELDKYLGSFPEDRRARKYLADAHVRLGQNAQKTGDSTGALRHFEDARKSGGGDAAQVGGYVQQAKKKMAEDLYDQGVRMSRTDLAKAIELWKSALTYDPSHVGSRVQLDKAVKMQEKLKKIQ